MPTKIKIKNGPTLEMEVAEDCVVFAGRCICHQIKENAEVMIRKTKAAGKTKIVIVGDCDDHHGDEKMLAIMSNAGIECKWFPEERLFLGHATPNFSETGIRRFAEADEFRKLRNLLEKIGRRVWDIKQRIEGEKKLLTEYPVVAKVQAIESHDHNSSFNGTTQKWLPGHLMFNVLFKTNIPNNLVSSVNAVMLLNPANNTGLLVTKSQEIKFVLARPHDFSLDILQGRGTTDYERQGYTKDNFGSIRINIGEGSSELSIYCFPGVWKIKQHPELDTMDPDVHYVPMWKRVEQVK